MDINEIIGSSDIRSIGMYFNRSYLYHMNNIVEVIEVREDRILRLRNVADRNSFFLPFEDAVMLRSIDVPNFYYKCPFEIEEGEREYQYIYVYKRPNRTTVKGLNSTRIGSSNPYYDYHHAIHALHTGDVIFTDKFAWEGYMWYRGHLVGMNQKIQQRYEWLGE